MDAPFVVSGEIDLATAPKMARALEEYCAQTEGDVVVDCSAMTFIDSTGLAVFQTLRRDLDGRRLELRHVVGPCRRAFEIVGMDELITD
jgi:anti-sigma B factor antagonist